ncbi:LmeA family phospholipid-binding protein [Gordonia crocea]|uniref:DUF2993 domain-containing protein n=1 Tax=Gordonia crocea TaxID=589162 RepID=A0A7I9UUZ9_9ACTN|nr:DUF2993 domain-containing protein [Gordonia crocea]GED96752.1 hypothetical protein nbrc107697_07910 [Gordonia crocea]
MSADDEWTSADEPVSLEKQATTRTPGKVTKSAPAKKKQSRKTGRWIGIGLVAALVVALVGLGGTELYLRHQVGSCLSKAFGSLTGAPTEVSMSARPVLWQALTKKIPFVEVNSKGGDAEGKMHLRVENITGSGDKSTIGSIKGDGHIPFSQVAQTYRSHSTPNPNSIGGTGATGQLESIRGNGDGTFDVTSTVTVVILPLPATVTLRPSVRDGKAHFEVVRANVVAVGIPPEFAQTVVDETSEAMLGSMLKGLTLSKLEVRGDGVDFAVSGTDVAVDENLIRPRSDCQDVTTALR